MATTAKKKPATVTAGTKTISAPKTQSIINPEYKSFIELVNTIQEEVKKVVDYRKSVHDVSPETIRLYTNNTIKKLIRSSKWA